MNIAFVGLRHAHIFDLYKMALANPETRVVGLWEADAPALAAAQRRIDAPVYESLEALLQDPRVDIVAVGDYYGARGAEVLAALRAGKHVLCDKPLATSEAELNAIEALSRERGLHVGCMLSLRYDAALRLAREVALAGDLGEIHALGFTGQHPLQYGKRPSWYFEPGKHGGTINDIAVHGLDAVAMITGLRFEQTVCARQWNAFARREPAFTDCAQFLARYENGAGLAADVSYGAPDNVAFSLPSYWRFNFWGEKGALECRLGGGEVLLSSANGSRAISAPPCADDELRELLRAIRGERTFLPVEALFASSRAALAAQRAADRRAGEGER